MRAQLAGRCAEAAAGLDEADAVAASDVVHGVRPVLAAALPTPPATPFRLDAEAVMATAERAGTGPFAATSAGDLLEVGAPPNQLEQIDLLHEGWRIHSHTGTVAGWRLNQGWTGLKRT